MEDPKDSPSIQATGAPIASSAATASADDQQLKMSKNQLKKIRKRERMLEIKKERKEKEKAAKRAKAEAEGRDLEAEHALFLQRTAAGDRKRRLQAMWDSEKLPLAKASFRICLDCSFEEFMTEKEIASLAKQLTYCYSYNKRSPHPCLWSATDLDGSTLENLEKETGYSEWANRAYTGTVQPLEEYYKDELENVVYLTSDSDNTITELDNTKIYVIGGIVDRNRLKRAAIDRAEKLGVATAKLPLTEHLAKMPATRVLTCNHVFDILLKYRENGNDWNKALQQVLPSRKEAEFKEVSTAKPKHSKQQSPQEARNKESPKIKRSKKESASDTNSKEVVDEQEKCESSF